MRREASILTNSPAAITHKEDATRKGTCHPYPLTRYASTVGEIAPGTGKTVTAGGKELAVFNVEGTVHVIDNECPHRGGPLGEGDVEGKIVVCPWHAWRWDVTTGSNANNPAVRVACYPVTVDEGVVFVSVS